MITTNINLRCLLLCLSITGVLGNGQSLAASPLKNCYNMPGVTAPQQHAKKVLYVFIDQTMSLSKPMQQAVIDLVSQWGNNGERVSISRFSARIKGQYTELVFDEAGSITPGEAYLYRLQQKDKKKLLKCLKQRKADFHETLISTLTTTLKQTNNKIPKTDLLYSLNDLANQLVANDGIQDKTVLLISDGLENSDIFSFHYRHKIKLINPKMMLDIVRRKHLIPNWHGAKIYMLGLGHIANDKFYARPKIIEPLKRFWRDYFTEGHGALNVNSIGTPMLLTKSIL
jgi:hypothetical protein